MGDGPLVTRSLIVRREGFFDESFGYGLIQNLIDTDRHGRVMI